MTTVVLADDEALLRKAMAALLPLEGEITVLADTEDGEPQGGEAQDGEAQDGEAASTGSAQSRRSGRRGLSRWS